MAFNLARYNMHTEELIRFLLVRADGDELLASGLPRWARIGLISRRELFETVSDYRTCVGDAVRTEERWLRLVWIGMARFNALLLRMAAREHKNREGFKREWLRPPR